MTAYQHPDYGLGNFIMITPTIKKLSEKTGSPVDVFFASDYVKQCFLDCDFMNINNNRGNISVHSGMINRKIPDYKYVFEQVIGEPWSEDYHTYVDSPKEFDFSGEDYIVVLNGLAGTAWKGKKEVDKKHHLLISAISDVPVYFTGSKTDLSQNTPWAETVFDKCFIGDIRQSLALIRDAKKVIANDTGLSHAAGAMNKEMLILWKDTPFEKNQNPGVNTRYSRKGEWSNDIKQFLL
jgi:hypothetical protein